MRILSESFFHKHIITGDFTDVNVVCIPGQGISHFNRDSTSNEENPLDNAILLHIPFNVLTENALESIWRVFPAAWWVNLSNNSIGSLDCIHLPLALGSLNLSHNSFRINVSENFAACHIMRLFVSADSITSSHQVFDEEWDRQLSIAAMLPNVWVINEHFIPYQDRNAISQGLFKLDLSHHASKAPVTSNWSSIKVNDRQQALLGIISQFEKTCSSDTDSRKLDILLEDYTNEIDTWNNYCKSLSLQNTAAVRVAKPIPLFKNFDTFLFIPHRLRLDLSVLLTASVLFPISDHILYEALIIALGEYYSLQELRAIATFPSFIKTAVVSLLRRITKIEHQDLLHNQESRIKLLGLSWSKSSISEDQSLNSFVPTFEGAEGFKYLRNVKRYLNFRFIYTMGYKCSKIAPFTELEIEILSYLPDIPTKWSGFKEFPLEGSETIRRHQWVAFAARHAIFLINRAPSCPSLTRVATTSNEQAAYLDLLKLLKAANMTLVDLEIISSGPLQDGRVIHNIQRASDLRSDKKSSVRQRRLIECFQLLDGKMIPYGLGLPHASKRNLRWKSGLPIRHYVKPWKQSDDTQSEASTNNDLSHTMNDSISTARRDPAFFVTEGDAQTTAAVPIHEGLTTPYKLSDDNVVNVTSMGASYIKEFKIDLDELPVARPVSKGSRRNSPPKMLSRKTNEEGDVDLDGYAAPSVSPPAFRPDSRGPTYSALSHKLFGLKGTTPRATSPLSDQIYAVDERGTLTKIKGIRPEDLAAVRTRRFNNKRAVFLMPLNVEIVH